MLSAQHSERFHFIRTGQQRKKIINFFFLKKNFFYAVDLIRIESSTVLSQWKGVSPHV